MYIFCIASSAKLRLPFFSRTMYGGGGGGGGTLKWINDNHFDAAAADAAAADAEAVQPSYNSFYNTST